MMKKSSFKYQVHIGYEGWMNHARNGVIVGNRGDKRTIQALKIWIDDEDNIDVISRVYFPSEGWSPEIHRGEVAGSTGKGKAIYGVCLSLEDMHPSRGGGLHIFYRVRGVGTFWSDWKKDGEKIYSNETPIVAIQIYLSDEKDASVTGVLQELDDEHEARVYASLDYTILKNKHDILFNSSPAVKFGETPIKNGFFSNYNELENLALEYGTDKSSLTHNYTRKYDFFLKSYRDKDITILELGVFKGASIKMWGDYFTNGHIIGVDIDENCRQYEGDNREVLISDLSDVENLRALTDFHPMVIIDDASHIWSHQIKALFILLSALQSGGIYIMEDLETSFTRYKGKFYEDACASAYEILAAIAEVVTSGEQLNSNGKNPLVLRLADKIEALAVQIEMISFINGSCIMVKK